MRAPTPPPFAAPDLAVWSKLWLDGLSLWLDASAVIGMRLMRIGAGGKLAERESERMVTEKLAANAQFLSKLWWGTLTSPQAAATTALRIYGSKVRANRRRLAG